MKKKLFLLAVLIFPIAAMGQIIQNNVPEVKVTPPVFTNVQKIVVAPERPSADPLEFYLTENFNYPDIAAKCYIEGTAIVQFMVHPDGELSDFEVINSVCPAIDKEFIRVLKTTDGMWKPGYNNNTPTEMETEVSMMFVANRTNQQNPKAYFMKNAKMLFTKGNNLFLVKGNPKKALNCYERSIKFMPYETSSLLLRGLCRFEMGDEKGACSDWKRINDIGKYDADPFIESLCELKGFAEMTQIINNNQE